LEILLSLRAGGEKGREKKNLGLDGGRSASRARDCLSSFMLMSLGAKTRKRCSKGQMGNQKGEDLKDEKQGTRTKRDWKFKICEEGEGKKREMSTSGGEAAQERVGRPPRLKSGTVQTIGKGEPNACRKKGETALRDLRKRLGKDPLPELRLSKPESAKMDNEK